MVKYLFYALFFIVPLIFFPKTSEVFEFNKMVVVYIFTVLISAAWVIQMIREKKIIFRRTILDIPLVLFLGSQIISTLISIDQRTSIFGYYSRFNGGLLSTICYALLYFAFVSNLDKRNSQKLLKITLISATIVAIYGILEHFGFSISCLLVNGLFNDGCWVQDVQTRVFATLGQPNWLSSYLVALTPLALRNVLKNKTVKQKTIWIVVSVIFFVCILFTKSKSGILGLAAAWIIFWIFNWRKNFKIFIAINILFLIIGLFFGTPITPSISSLISHTKQVQTTDTSEGGTDSGAIREIVWKGAINIWKANPIFGTGNETFGYSYWQYRPLEHNNTSEWDYLYNKAHNEYLNFAANTGSVGLITYIFLIGTSLFVLRKNYVLLAGYVSILVTNFFGFSVVIISMLTFILPAIAVSLNVKTEEKQNKEIKIINNHKLLVGGIILAAGFLIFLIGKYWYADYLYNQGRTLVINKSYENGIKSLQLAVDYSPNEAIYYNEMARSLSAVSLALLNSNEATNATQIAKYAISESQIAYQLSPRNMNINETRMGIFITLAKFDPQYLQKCVDLVNYTKTFSPTDPKLDLILGKAYANMGKFKESADAFKSALILKSDYDEAKKDLEILNKIKK